jgi:pimeloyl-[acyl-carrier protein] methyl ester esterase
MASSLYVKRQGKGTPLVLLHGWGWNSAIWEPLVPALSQYYQLVMIDLPGFGQSPLEISDYTFASIAPLLLEAVPEKAHWLGWSLGGMLAFWIAINYPEKVEKLITVSASPRFAEESDWPGVALPTLNRFANSLTTNYEKTMTDFLELQLRGSPQYDTLFPELRAKLFSEGSSDMQALQGGLELLSDTDLRADLSKIKCPSLHIFGKLDRLVPSRVAELLKPELPLSQSEVLAHSSHMPFLSQQEKFLELILNQIAI